MREFMVTAPRTIAWQDYEERPLEPHEVRVKTIITGIKHGTELNLYRGTTPFVEQTFDMDYRLFRPRDDDFYPVYLGSWGAGEVLEVGSDVTAFKVGQRVHGNMQHRPLNIRSDDRLYPLPDDTEAIATTFTDPMIFALSAVHDAQIKVGDNVAIFGMGALGLFAVQAARLNGAEHVYAVDLLDERLEIARQFGADAGINPTQGDAAFAIKDLTHKKGVDVAIEISGAYPALRDAVRCVHQGGRVVAAGYYKRGAFDINFGAEWHHNRPTLVSTMPVWGNPLRAHPMWDLPRLEVMAFKLIQTKRVQWQPMVGQTFDYADAATAYDTIDKNPQFAIKTFFVYE